MTPGEGIGGVVARLRAERGLSQTTLAALLADISGNPTVTRNDVSRWETGRRTPRGYWLGHLGAVFGLTVADLHDLARLSTRDNPEAAELAARVAVTDVGAQTLDRLETAVDDLAIAYPGTPPGLLLQRVRRHLGYVGKLLDGRKTLAEHRRLVVVGGWLSLLDATCRIDLDELRPAALNLRAAAELADVSEHPELSGWTLETRAWQALTSGDYRRALDLSRHAQHTAPEGSSAYIQATAQEGRVHARLGNTRDTLDALARVQRLVSPLPVPDRPEHHYRYDPSKSTAYVATTLSWLGDPAAEDYARQVLAHLESTDGGPPRPRRAASARLDLALALLASGKSDEASHIALDAVTSGRLVPSNYWRAREVIDAVDGRGVPEAAELRDAYESLSADDEG